jgi:transcriptional enhancer factor
VPGFLYSTTLVPQYWKVISKSSDPTRFTIYQEVSKSDNAALIFSATYKFGYPSGQSSAFPSPLDTPDSPNTRPDMHSLVSAASTEHAQFQGDRYPLYVAPEWSPSLHSREHSPAQGYHSPSSDSSTCFPSDLSNYVL